MLTPQEVQERTFERARFGGYDMAAVDDFLEPLTEDYISLYKENAVLKNKMKVLVDTMEEYRKTEDSIRTVLINAQKTADDIVAQAKKKSEEMLQNASNEAEKRNHNISSETGEWEKRLELAKKNTLDYIDNMRKVYKQQNDFIENLAALEVHVAAAKELENAQAVNTASDPAETAAAEIENSVQKIIENDEKDIKVRTEKDKQLEDETAAHKPKFEFVDLKFGKDYELK